MGVTTTDRPAAPAAAPASDAEEKEHRWRLRRDAIERGAPASWPSRIGALEVALLALVIAGDVVDHLPISALLGAGVLFGFVIGCIPPVRRMFTWITGWIIALIFMGVTFTVVITLGIMVGTPHALLVSVPLVGLVPLAADSAWASRLRTWILFTGLGVIVVIGISVKTFDGVPSDRARLAAVAWIALALITLRSIHNDIAAGVPRASPADGGEARAPRRGPLVLIALVLASLLALMYLRDVDASLNCGLHHATCAERRAQQAKEQDDTHITLPSTTTTRPQVFQEPDKQEESGIQPWVLLAILAAVVVVVLLGVAWWTRRRRRYRGGLWLGPGGFATRSSKWGEEMTRRLNALGERYNRPRGGAEPVASYAEALGEDSIRDPRLGGVGSVVSSAFFGRSEPPAEQQAWAEAVLTELKDRADMNPPMPGVDPGSNPSMEKKKKRKG
jgi:hypothetical protein